MTAGSPARPSSSRFRDVAEPRQILHDERSILDPDVAITLKSVERERHGLAPGADEICQLAVRRPGTIRSMSSEPARRRSRSSSVRIR